MRFVRAKGSPMTFDPSVTGNDRSITIPTDYIEVDDALAKVLAERVPFLVEFQPDPEPVEPTPAKARRHSPTASADRDEKE